MMRDGTPAYSNFDIAAYLTEIILLPDASPSAWAKARSWTGTDPTCDPRTSPRPPNS